MNKADLLGLVAQAQKPEVMRFLVTLNDEIDRDVFYRAIQRCMKRYPYFCFRIVPLDGNFDKVENPLPVVLFDSLDREVILGSEEVNYHWIAFAAEGNTFSMIMSHSIADGISALWVRKTLLWCYLTEKYGVELDPEGIILPESEIRDDEDIKVVTPVEDAEGMKIQSVEDPINIPEEPDSLRYYKIKFPEKDFLNLGKSSDTSPLALISIFMAKMFQRVFPENTKSIYAGVAADTREALNCPHSRFINTSVFFLKQDVKNLDMELSKLGTATRGQIMIQSDPVNIRFKHNKLMQISAAMMQETDPLKQQALMGEVYALMVSNPTYNLSYIGNPKWGSLAPYVLEEYTLIATSQLMIEVNAAGGKFCIGWVQRFANTKYVEEFRKLLEENGIACEVEGPFPFADPKCQLV